jgi:hypothetical protein
MLGATRLLPVDGDVQVDVVEALVQDDPLAYPRSAGMVHHFQCRPYGSGLDHSYRCTRQQALLSLNLIEVPRRHAVRAFVDQLEHVQGEIGTGRVEIVAPSSHRERHEITS